MVKLFIAGLTVFVLIVVGVFSAFLTPLMVGVTGNLGGSPHMPFHSPIPQPVVSAVQGLVGQATPSVQLTAALGLAALLLIYTAGSMVSHLLKRYKARKAQDAELRARARVATAQSQRHADGEPASPEVATRSAIEALWD